MQKAHAKLSASGSARWIACPGSVVLEALFDDEGSAYAEEGTLAHSVAEIRVRARIHPESFMIGARLHDTEMTTEPEMWAFAGLYEDYCGNLIDTMRLEGHTVRAYVEQRVCFDKWVPGGFGTVDFCAVGGDDLHIVDFKYGKGVPVSAESNSQMRAYALGFLQEMECIYDNIKTVTVHIVQPRIRNYSSEMMTTEELLDWANTVLKPSAETASKQTRRYAPGRHCRFCKAATVCKARTHELLSRLAEVLSGGKDNAD